MSKDNGGPAFPLHGLSQRNGQQIEQVFNGGMTLRDYFAAMAASAAVQGATWDDLRDGAGELARCSYAIADAMLAERSK